MPEWPTAYGHAFSCYKSMQTERAMTIPGDISEDPSEEGALAQGEHASFSLVFGCGALRCEMVSSAAQRNSPTPSSLWLDRKAATRRAISRSCMWRGRQWRHFSRPAVRWIPSWLRRQQMTSGKPQYSSKSKPSRQSVCAVDLLRTTMRASHTKHQSQHLKGKAERLGLPRLALFDQPRPPIGDISQSS